MEGKRLSIKMEVIKIKSLSTIFIEKYIKENPDKIDWGKDSCHQKFSEYILNESNNQKLLK